MSGYPQFFFVDFNSPCKDLLFPRGSILALAAMLLKFSSGAQSLVLFNWSLFPKCKLTFWSFLEYLAFWSLPVVVSSHQCQTCATPVWHLCLITAMHAHWLYRDSRASFLSSFSSPEAAPLLVSTKNRNFWVILVTRAHDPSGLRQESRALGATISGMRHRCRLRETGWAEFGYFLCYFKMVAPRALVSDRWSRGTKTLRRRLP